MQVAEIRHNYPNMLAKNETENNWKEGIFEAIILYKNFVNFLF